MEFIITDDENVLVQKSIKAKDGVADMINPNELLNDVKNILAGFKSNNQKRVLTVDIIRAHQGNYYNAKNQSEKKLEQ